MKNEEIVLIENLNSHQDILDIRWRVTSTCNYHCEFCIQGDNKMHAQLAKGESAELRAKICRSIRTLLQKAEGYRAVNLSLIGGEVSILKDFPSLLEQLANADFSGDIRFHITTNLSMQASYYCGLYDIVHAAGRSASGRTIASRSLALAASFYSAYTDRSAFENKLRQVKRHLRKLLLEDCLTAGVRNWRHAAGAAAGVLSDRSMGLSAGYPILTDKDYQAFETSRLSFEGSGIYLSPILIRQYHTDLSEDVAERLIAEEKEKKHLRVTDSKGSITYYDTIRSLGMDLEGTDRFDPRGCLCDAGMHSIWINAFGDVYRCPAIGSTMKMGSILEEKFSWLGAPAPCQADHCSCSQFTRIEKQVQVPGDGHPYGRNLDQIRNGEIKEDEENECDEDTRRSER